MGDIINNIRWNPADTVNELAMSRKKKKILETVIKFRQK
jgi:hypothetical protein